MATKYIVDNLPNQTISGDVIINGNLSVTGVTTGGLVTYKALLTQIVPISANNLSNFNGAFVIGETYTITNYQLGDDFSNIANVQSGVINETGCVFIATGYIPTIWINGSDITSSGNLVVDVLENNLGYDIEWGMFQPGVYIAYPTNFGPKYNNFPRDKSSILSQITLFDVPFDLEGVKYFTYPLSLGSKDDVIGLIVWDYITVAPIQDTLWFTPIELKMKVDVDNTPIVVSGTVVSSYPFSYASVDMFCNSTYVEGYYGDNVLVNNITELITELNTNAETSYLGTYSDDGLGNVLLTMTTSLKNRFCSSGTLTFEVYAD